VLYRKIRKTGDEISVLGFGAMRLPSKNGRTDEKRAIQQIRYAIDHGINYIDTAIAYMNEPLVARALSDGYREKVKIATKLPPWSVNKAEDMENIFKVQLDNFKTDHIDYYMLHGLNRPNWDKMMALGVLELLTKLKRNGSIINAGFSFHGDKDTFKEFDAGVVSADPLKFPDYSKRLHSYGTHKDAVVTGEAKMGKHSVALCVMDFEYMGGSMGSVVGEKIVRTVEYAIENSLPVIIVSASGGARMQEGILSLMQMGKTSAALALLAEKKLPFISILTDPTTGGVAASFAMLGDVIVAEPNALIGFAGPRVIEQTIRQKLPAGFQLSEFLMGHGIVDVIAERKDLKDTVIKLLDYLMAKV